MRYFIVGKPIQYLESSFLHKTKVRSFSKETLISEAWEKQSNFIKIFDNYAHALTYARSLRQVGRRLSVPQIIEKNLAAPIFTLEFTKDLELGNPNLEDIDCPGPDSGQMLKQRVAFYWIQSSDYLISIISNIEIPDTAVQEIVSTNGLYSFFF